MDPIPSPRLPLPVSSLRRVLALAPSPEHLVVRLGGVIARLAGEGVSVRVLAVPGIAESSGGPFSEERGSGEKALRLGAAELGVDDVVVLPWDNRDGRERLPCGIHDQLGDADAVLVASGEPPEGEEALLARAGVQVAAAAGRLLVEAGLPAAAPPRSPDEGTEADPRHYVLAVDRTRQLRAARALFGADGHPGLGRLSELAHDRVRLHSAPYDARLRFVAQRLDPLARPHADASERADALHVLRCFAQAGDWPAEVMVGDPGGRECTHPLHSAPGWTLASVVLVLGQATPVHQHDGWGAAVTVVGVERNLRYRGSLPDDLELVDEQIAPAGGGYLFESRLIHQAVDGTGQHTASLHFLVHGHGPD